MSEPSSHDRREQSETRSASCPEHGTYESRAVLEGRLWTQCPACIAEGEKRRLAVVAERRAEAARERHEQRIVFAGVPARFRGQDFKRYTATEPAQMRALSVVRDFAEQFEDARRRGRGLVLLGMPGTGKTMLALAAVQSLLDEWSVRYLTCLDLVREVRSSWGRKSSTSESDMMQNLADVDLLVIDEVGASFGSDSEKTIVFDVLDRRYREMLPTVIVTNEDADGLKACIGDRASDRLVETSRWVIFNWASHRKAARSTDA